MPRYAHKPAPLAINRRTGVTVALLASSASLLLSLSAVSYGVPPKPTSKPTSNRAIDDYDKTVKPFLTRYCFSCHDAKVQRGGLRLDNLAHDFSVPVTAMHWGDLRERINTGEMPPKGALQPKPDEAGRIADWITAQMKEADATAKAGLGEKVSFRRLTREEYRNTVHDLLGVNYDVIDPTGLPEDPDWQGFQRIGSVLTVSPAHIEKYLAAAESILNEAIPLAPPKHEVIHWDPFRLRAGYGWGQPYAHYVARGNADKVRVDISPNSNAYGGAGGNEQLTINTTGEYRVRVKLSALRPAGGTSPRISFYAADLGRTLFERDVEAPEDKPTTLEFRTHLPAGTHPIRIFNAVPGPPATDHATEPGAFHGFTDIKRRQPWQIKATDEENKPLVPFLLLDSVEWEGPMLESWPTPAYHRIFFKSESKGQFKSEGATQDLAYARQILARFAERAYRRPVQPVEVDRLVKLFQNAQQLGDNFETAIRTPLLAVLCSKSFLYLVEGQPDTPAPVKPVKGATPAKPATPPHAHTEASKKTGTEGTVKSNAASRLTDWELASRLSYFLWSTMPDEHLMDLARTGRLHEPATLRAEVQRMMRDARTLAPTAFADAFPRQWLQLRRLGMFPPDRKIYTEYDDYLEKSMVDETTAYFREVLTHNLGIDQFLDSDWAMLNRRLAIHYGITGVDGEELHRVALKPEDHRGGLLTQAAILSLTSDGTRHRPVHRGKWVLESILGKPPPVPPANVPAIKTTEPNQPKMTLRAKLEAHRQDPNCASCHRKIDPLGLAFDNYDAVGHWRTEEAVTDGAGANPPLDPSGVLPDGRKFADAAGLKKLLLADNNKFAAALTEKLATYALRRAMTFSDRDALQHITAQNRTSGYRLASLVQTLATSDLFQHR